MLTILEVATIVLAGWLAGAESGSWSCVHPVIAKLEPQDIWPHHAGPHAVESRFGDSSLQFHGRQVVTGLLLAAGCGDPPGYHDRYHSSLQRSSEHSDRRVGGGIKPRMGAKAEDLEVLPRLPVNRSDTRFHRAGHCTNQSGLSLPVGRSFVRFGAGTRRLGPGLRRFGRGRWGTSGSGVPAPYVPRRRHRANVGGTAGPWTRRYAGFIVRLCPVAHR